MQIGYTETDKSLGPASLMPYANLEIALADRTTSITCLVDSGAALNVLPFRFGIQLGLDWSAQRVPIRLSGNLEDADARAILLTTKIGDFAAVQQAFAWSKRDDIPTILGQVNFFLEFDISFFRSQSFFEITPRMRNK